MMKPNEYNVATILDIARIPEDRFPAFLEEFPRLIEQARTVLRNAESMGYEFTVSERKIIWVDDDGTSPDEIRVDYDLSDSPSSP